jgi:hypothetical protein
MIASRERVDRRRGVLIGGLVDGLDVGVSAESEDGGAAAGGEGDRWLMASANNDSCNEMADKARVGLLDGRSMVFWGGCVDGRMAPLG